MEEPLKLVIDPAILPAAKNTDGLLGEKCNNCGGYGYTMSIGGKSAGCQDCDQTGVKLPTRRELQNQIIEIRKDLKNLRKAILDSIGIKVEKPNGIRQEAISV